MTSTLYKDERDTDQAVLKEGRSPTLGEFAHRMMANQYHRLIKQEQKVLADKDPEPLHQMRVAIRRLRTALRVFGMAVEVPKDSGDKRLRKLARELGKLRDLDVQIDTLKKNYHPRLNKAEQELVDDGLVILHKHRRKAFATIENTLTHTRYKSLKAAYVAWLEQPQFTPLAQLPLLPLLPDLLNPLLSDLLLHPAWVISIHQISPENSSTLHDLRKLCKQVRYQAEFFAPFYSEAFQAWIDDIKGIQDSLGKVQDSQVLLGLLVEELPRTAELPELQATIQHEQVDALSGWETLRQTYLSPDFRHSLHQLILEPILPGRKDMDVQESGNGETPLSLMSGDQWH